MYRYKRINKEFLLHLTIGSFFLLFAGAGHEFLRNGPAQIHMERSHSGRVHRSRKPEAARSVGSNPTLSATIWRDTQEAEEVALLTR